MRKVLIIGTGLLGGKLAKRFTEKFKFEVFTTYAQHRIPISGCKTYKMNIANRHSCKIIKKIKPDYIVHTAAFTNVDACETHKEEAFKINVNGTKHIAEASKEINAKLGEKVVKDLRDFIIVRPSVLYGGNPVMFNFVTWVIEELKKGNGINIVKDQFNTPTLADNLAELILELIEKEENGIFHASGSERINRYDFAIKIAAIFDLNKELIKPIASDQLNWIAKRPMDSSLDTSKISRIKKPLSIEDALTEMRDLE